MDIYVGNLAYSTNDESLRNAFAAYGEVASARVVSDRMTGRSKGFGFVEMPDRAQAQAAIAVSVAAVAVASVAVAVAAVVAASVVASVANPVRPAGNLTRMI